MTNLSKLAIFVMAITGLLCPSCQIADFPTGGDTSTDDQTVALSSAGLQCVAQAEETDYQVYKMSNDGYRIGDLAPFYDASSGKFMLYHLKDIWDDPSNQRHPIHAFTTTNFYDFTENGEIIASSSDNCAQDFAVGAASFIKENSTYYGFYTGHNPNSGSCGTFREGVMLATSSDPTSSFVKDTTFATINVPLGQGFDENDNFRDPYVFKDNGTFYMLISARKDIGGIMKGVIIYYTSSDLYNWTYQGVLYDGGPDNYWMMECAQVIQFGSTYYLIYSDQIGKHLLYRKSSNPTGPWSAPSGNDRFAGKGIFAAKAITDSYGDHYLAGWTNILTGNTDDGDWAWGGNLVAHKIYPMPNGDLAATIPHTLEAYMQTDSDTILINSQWGDVTNTQPGEHSYRIISQADFDVANVIFEPIAEERYMISTTMSFDSSAKDFGFMIGACDGYNDFYSLRFIPSENRFSFDKTNRDSLTTTSEAVNDVPLTLAANTNYDIKILIENSMVVVYINNQVALSNRIYKASNTHWGIFTDHSDVTFTDIRMTHP
ncbi:glycoside hydrolase family 32 protein [Echinicola jeungdonensis]|uniref:beta-fructofuranosidase n=1 Tax=Echinicola jeungdonensis TaxID=709343 RepID=A0ABV5J7K9_9BACT|nr:glycoside hydrolase family 32 protein [Echinicola jeungdonensis]MDN3669187.1 glycoside hydrolase family 32 protein [Echinicola jeungdonensis]